MVMKSRFSEILPRSLTPGEADRLREVLDISPAFSSNLRIEGRRLVVELRHPFGDWGSEDEVRLALGTWARQLRVRLEEFLATDVVAEATILLQRFKSFVERQGRLDLWVNGSAREQVARGILQAYLDSRSYQEVPTSTGRSDLLVLSSRGTRLVFEAKIWRGPKAFCQGIEQLWAYVDAENDDGEVAAAFYVVFDPSRNHQAEAYVASHWEQIVKRECAGPRLLPVIINIDRNAPSARSATPNTPLAADD